MSISTRKKQCYKKKDQLTAEKRMPHNTIDSSQTPSMAPNPQFQIQDPYSKLGKRTNNQQ
jgi:hypothetical protein